MFVNERGKVISKSARLITRISTLSDLRLSISLSKSQKQTSKLQRCCVTWLLQWRKVMARTTRSRRKMANTTDAPSPASSLLSSTTTAPFTSPTSATYSTEGYTFNYTGLPSLGGYSLEDLNYTELWVDVWNSTEASNVTERLNTTVLSSGGGYCDEWEAAQHKLFQVYALFL